MPQPAANTSASRQVELIIRRLNSLSVLPQTARRLFGLFSEHGAGADKLAELISSDAALAAKILSIAAESGIEDGSIEALCRKLPFSTVRDAALAVKVFEVFDPDYDPDSKRLLPRKQIAIHSLSVAIAARLIAQYTDKNIDPQKAFAAGLLHDIGKLAIDEVMPKSFEKIVEEARAMGSSLTMVEKKNLGVDHCVVGKRLAEKWNLPEEIVTAIWLHHDDSAALPEINGSAIAHVVGAADKLVRSLGIGESGNFEKTDFAEDILTGFGLGREKSSQLIAELGREIEHKKVSLALEATAGSQSFISAMQSTAASVAKLNTDLYKDNLKLNSETAVSKFLNQFVAEIKSEQGAVEIAAAFAKGFARTYQTGTVCVLLKGESREMEAAVVTQAAVDYTIVAIPEEFHIDTLRTAVSGSAAMSCVPWVFKKLDNRLDPSAKLVPLVLGTKFLGLLIYETARPDAQLPGIEQALTLVSTLIALAQSNYKHKRLSENFAYVLGELKETNSQLASAKSMLAVAELAAGAAHEFNNPLAVISGRAQLLGESESDPQRKQMLKQIQDRAGEITSMISDLMFFANPPEPVRKNASLSSIIQEAIVSAAAKTGVAGPEVSVTGLEKDVEVFVDAGQVTMALANIVANAFESYHGAMGPVAISAVRYDNSDQIEIRIKDNGCGMDVQTLAKAQNPFFSAKLAGRKRGIGLSHAQRLIQQNNGSLKISSVPNAGTNVIVLLPSKSRLSQ